MKKRDSGYFGNINGIILLIVITTLLVPLSISKPYAEENNNLQINGEWISLDGSGEIIPPKFTVISANANEIIFNLYRLFL